MGEKQSIYDDGWVEGMYVVLREDGMTLRTKGTIYYLLSISCLLRLSWTLLATLASLPYDAT